MAEKFELETTPLIHQPNAPLYALLRNQNLPMASRDKVEEVLSLPPCQGESAGAEQTPFSRADRSNAPALYGSKNNVSPFHKFGLWRVTAQERAVRLYAQAHGAAKRLRPKGDDPSRIFLWPQTRPSA